MSEADKSCKTTCPYCGVGCGVVATQIEDGSVQIKGDPDHPSNYGRLCSKGAALGETLGERNRLLYPEVEGQRMSWDGAIAIVADQFGKAIREYGPDSVAFYVSGQLLTEDYYVANKLMKGYLGSANIDTNSRLCMASSVAGHKRAFGSDTVPGTYEDLELADLIVLVGSNLAWCHPVLYQRIRAAKEARPDMKIVLIDPRNTVTSELADLHLPICPDGDVTLFDGLLAYLAEKDVLDRSYIENYTEGFDDLLSHVIDLDLIEVSQKTELNIKDLKTFFDLFSCTEKTVTIYSQGVNQARNGTDKVNAILNCHLATGRIGKPGSGPFSITGQPNAMGGREVGGLANMLAAHMDIHNPTHRERVQTYWQSPVIATTAGLKAVDMFEAVRASQIKAIWIMATNPVDSLPAADRVAEALKICPFVVVSDIYDNTDTIQYANVKLPSLGWGEKDGTVTNSERRISRQKAFLPAPGDARADWRQLASVAGQMGFESAFNFQSAAEIFREHAALSAFENNGERTFDIGGLRDISDAAYTNMKPVQWPVRNDDDVLDKRFYADGNFQTASGRGQFVKSANLTSPQIAADEFSLNTGRIRDQWHTMTRTARAVRLTAHIAEPFCEISAVDAAVLGIKEADVVRIYSDIGEIYVRALITNRVQRGQIFVPIHWTDQFASNARVDKIIAQITDPISGQPATKNATVRLETTDMKTFAYVLCRQKPDQINADYWAVSPVTGGWQIECAYVDKIIDPVKLRAKLGLNFSEQNIIEYGDLSSGDLRQVVFEGDELSLFIKTGSRPVEISRSWAVDQLSVKFENLRERVNVISGRPANGIPDKGAIICSCFSVGALEISGAVRAGCCTVSDIGKRLKAGTNCGSCKSEIKTLIVQNLPQAAE